MNSTFIRDRIQLINLRIACARIGMAMAANSASYSDVVIGAARLAVLFREVPPIVLPWYYRVWFWFLDLFSHRSIP